MMSRSFVSMTLKAQLSITPLSPRFVSLCARWAKSPHELCWKRLKEIAMGSKRFPSSRSWWFVNRQPKLPSSLSLPRACSYEIWHECRSPQDCPHFSLPEQQHLRNVERFRTNSWTTHSLRPELLLLYEYRYPSRSGGRERISNQQF